MDIEEILENFTFLESGEERYRYIIDLGKELEGLPDADKVEDNRVHGCQSRVWMVAGASDGEALVVKADSDAFVVRGLIAIVLATFAGKTPQEAISLDVESVFEKIGLAQQLSMGRRNGLHAMVQRIRALGARHAV
jgi:cysteine desulfuration protein SufE